MKRIFTLVSVVFFSAMVSQETPAFEKRQVVIGLTDAAFSLVDLDLHSNSFGNRQLDEILAPFVVSGMEPVGNMNRSHAFLITFSDDIDVEQIVRNLQHSSFVRYAEPNFIARGGGEKGTMATIPNDAFFHRQWGFVNNGTMSGIGPVQADADVDMELAWDLETGDPEMIIAVPDSGLQMTHPDIASRIWINPGEIAGNGIDDDANGKIDDVKGWDWVSSDNNPADDLGHGTNCIGILGAIANNSLLYAGANWNSRIMPLKVLNSANSSSYFHMASAIYYAVDNGAKIISMSIGGTGAAVLLSDAITYAAEHDVLLVFCMMNTNNSVTYYPAGFSLTHSNVIAVGSTDANDERSAPFFWGASSGSNFGNHINVVAPGNYIYGLDWQFVNNANSYWGGTSQATPLVAGIASLLLSHFPDMTPAELRAALQNTAQDQVGNPSEDLAGFDPYMGYGRVNAFAALQYLALSVPQNQTQEFSIVNPVRHTVLEFSSKGNHDGMYSITVMDMQGKLLDNIDFNVEQGKNSLLFDYPTGNYIVTFKSRDYSKVFKVVKE